METSAQEVCSSNPYGFIRKVKSEEKEIANSFKTALYKTV